MAKILVIESSARKEGSYSRMLVAEFVADLNSRGANHEFVYRDLVDSPVPVLHEGIVDIIRTPVEALQPEQRRSTALSEALIAELKAADFVVIGCPMYNWSIPAALKAWLDQVMRLGLTFARGETGLTGLLDDKPALVVLSRGGSYDNAERAAVDMQKPYLANVLKVMGLSATFAVMEGSLMEEQVRDSNLRKVRTQIKAVADHFDRYLLQP
jgi:FMN-dependent NADH-azoreductase